MVIAITSQAEPFVQYKSSADNNGAPMVDGKRLEVRTSTWLAFFYSTL